MWLVLQLLTNVYSAVQKIFFKIVNVFKIKNPSAIINFVLYECS